MDFTNFINLLNPVSWIANLGKEDTKSFKEELTDLLDHSTKTLRTMLEINKLLDMLDLEHIDDKTFKVFYYNIRDLYIGDQMLDKTRSHCTDIERDIRRIILKASILLRSELSDYKNIVNSFNSLLGADGTFMGQITDISDELGKELEEAYVFINKGMTEEAKERLLLLRRNMREEMKKVEDVINEMQKAENNIRKSLT